MSSVISYNRDFLPIRSVTAAQAARIRARVQVSDHLARALAEIAFGSRVENTFGLSQPISAGAH